MSVKDVSKEPKYYSWFGKVKSYDWPFTFNNGIRYRCNLYSGGGIGIEAYVGTTDLSLEFSAQNDSEDSLQFHIAIPFLFKVFLTLDLSNRKWMNKVFFFDSRDYYKESREWGIHFYKEDISFNIKMGAYKMGSSSNDPWYYSFNINILDILLGKTKYDVTTQRNGLCHVPMPEKIYEGKYRIDKITHKRPRWFSKHFYRVDIEVEEGIPHPGKGTTDYNCADDKTFSLSIPGKSVDECILKYRDSVMYCRDNYPL